MREEFDIEVIEKMLRRLIQDTDEQMITWVKRDDFFCASANIENDGQTFEVAIRNISNEMFFNAEIYFKVPSDNVKNPHAGKYVMFARSIIGIEEKWGLPSILLKKVLAHFKINEKKAYENFEVFFKAYMKK